MSQNIIIKLGDTLAALAAKYGTTVEELSKLNDIKNANSIFEGKTLKIRNEGLSVEKTNTKKESESPVKQAPDDTKNKTTEYVVQLGDTIEGVVRKSLKAQGIENPDKKQLKDATDKFINDNGGVGGDLIKTNKKGVTVLRAAATVKLDGDVDIHNNKSADEVEAQWAKKNGKYGDFTRKSKDGFTINSSGVRKGNVSAKEVWSNGTTVERSGDDGHGHFTKKVETRKDGTVIVSTEPSAKDGAYLKRVIDKNGTQITYSDLNAQRTKYEKEVTSTGLRKGDFFEHEVWNDGTTVERSGDDGHGHFAQKIKKEKDGTITTSTEPDEKSGHFKKSVNNKGITIIRSGNNGHGRFTKEIETDSNTGAITTSTVEDGHNHWTKRVKEQKDGTIITTNGIDKDGKYESEVTTNPKTGTTITKTGDDGNHHWAKRVEERADGTTIISSIVDKNGKWENQVTTDSKTGTTIERSGDDGHGHWNKEVETQKDGTVTTRTDPDGNGGWKKIEIQKK